MKLYLAGPMTGIKDLNFPAFHAEAARLRALGYVVINPAEIVADQSTPWNACMRADIAQLVTCDSVALLDGWTASRGARLEHHIALELGMSPRLAAFFVERVQAPDTCTRCGGGHRLSQCNWPTGARQAFESAPSLQHLDFTWSNVRDEYLSYSTTHAFRGFLAALARPGMGTAQAWSGEPEGQAA